MAGNEEVGKVTVEVELAPAQEQDGPFAAVIKVRIIGSDRHAFQMVKDAVLVAIQGALNDCGEDVSEDTSMQLRH
jgi:hypothetical protein